MKKYFGITILLICFLCVGCGKEDEADVESIESVDVIEDAEIIESADVIEERLGIKMGMAEDIKGASDFQYSIIDDEIGQVRFIYKKDVIFFRASKTKTWEEMGEVADQDGSVMATTMDWDTEEGSYTAVCFLDLEGGGSALEWSGSGIRFMVIMPFDTSVPRKSRFAEQILYKSYQ